MIERYDELCVHCGACVGQCTAGALTTNPDTFEVGFAGERCADCRRCLAACGYGALRPLAVLRTGTEGP